MKIMAIRFVRCFNPMASRMENHFDAATKGELLEKVDACELCELVKATDEQGLSAEAIDHFKEKWVRLVAERCGIEIGMDEQVIRWPHQTSLFVVCRVVCRP